MTPAPKPVRLDKLLANMGYGVRKDIAAMARAGLIKVGGEPIRKADTKLRPDASLQTSLTIDGAPVDPLPGMAVMLHKPLGVTCSKKDPGKLVHDLLPPRWRTRDPSLSTVGRLDKDTSGLLILTDDGQLNHRITSPKTQTPKRYLVTLDRPMNGSEAKTFAAGGLMLEGEDKPLLPAELDVIDDRHAALTIHEGRYHQVRRMFAALGNHVAALHRAQIGGLALPEDLPPGEWSLMTDSDIAAIFAD